MDPLSIVTSVITLSKTLQSFTKLIADYSSADVAVANIRSTCELATFVLADIQEQLDAKVRPTLLGEGSDGGQSGTGAGVNLANVLKHNVSQLQLDVNLLVNEVKNLFKPERPASRVGEWKSSTTLVWKKSYLEGMHGRILTKLTQLQLVQANLQQQANSVALSTRDSHGNIHETLARSKSMPPGRSERRSSVNPYIRQRLIKAIRERDGDMAEKLLAQTDPNFAADDTEKLHPLHIAVMNDDMPMTRLLLDFRAKVDCSHGKPTPLMLALENNFVNIALELISRGADVSQTNGNGQTPIHIAARMNQYAIVQVLLDNIVDPNARDTIGHTPLFECVNSAERHLVPRDVSVLGVLLDKKANPTFGRIEDNFSPLHLAAQEGYINDLDILAKAVESRGLTVESQSTCDKKGRSPLWYAAYKAQVEAIKLLIKFGADVNRRFDNDKKRPTALWAVVLSRNAADKSKALLLLLNEGADPNIGRNIKGQSLLIAACESADASLVKLLLQYGADPRASDQRGKQPIHYAAINGDQEVVDLLLKCESHPVDINCTDPSGDTPLIFAGMNGHDYLVKFLQRYEPQRADWSLTNNSGCDAFYLACATGHTLCAAYLHGLGADINKPNNNQNTPLHVAARGGHFDTVLWLLRMGADKSAKALTPSGGMATADEVPKQANIGKGLAESVSSLIKHWTPDQGRTEKLRAVLDERKRLLKG